MWSKTPGRLLFTGEERAYLALQPLARLATIDATGQPDTDVAGFELDGDNILIASYRGLATSRAYRNVAAGTTKVSLIVNRLVSVEPMDIAPAKIHGTAASERRTGRFPPHKRAWR